MFTNNSSFNYSSILASAKEVVAQLRWPDYLALGGSGVGILCLAVGSWLVLSQAGTTSIVSQVQAQELQPQTSVVAVIGAVANPGVFTVTNDSRLGQVIEQAGGFLPEADPQKFAQKYNLAEYVQDQQQIEVPFFDVSLGVLKASQTETEAVSGVSINTASAAELTTLEGIGEKRAADIIANRPYATLDELLSKEVLTQNLFTKIENQIRL